MDWNRCRSGVRQSTLARNRAGTRLPASLQGIVYQFDTLDDLAETLESTSGDPELSLPCRDGVREGEWLLVTLRVGEEATCAAGRVEDRGGELRLVFEERDWQRMESFARGDSRPSIPPSAQPLVPEVVSAPAGATALLIDDDATVLTILRAMLASCGLATETAHDGEEALDLIQRRHFDLVLLDPSVDGRNGYDLCRRVRAETRVSDVPILVLTWDGSDGAVRGAFCAGADDFVAKPFRAHELRARVLGLLHRAQTCEAASAR